MKHGGNKKEDELLQVSSDNYSNSVIAWQHIYDAAIADLKFVYDIDNGQWDKNTIDKRTSQKLPIITVNKLLKFVRQIRGDQMMNRPRMKVIPVDNNADVKMAELYNDLIRQIEYLSTVSIAYDTAYMQAVSGSIGFYRIITKYMNDSNFDQNILIKRILNPFLVHFDPRASDFNLEDARYCFIEENMEEKEFKKAFPGAQTDGFSGDTTGSELMDWFVADTVKVAEYFYKEAVTKKIAQLDTGEIVELNKKNTTEYLYSLGKTVTKTRDVKSHKVMWLKRSGCEILEGPTEWPGKYIPIIPVFGEEVVVSGQKHYLSAIRGAKDPAKMYNYWASSATEHIMSSPKPQYIVDHRQIKGFEKEWANVQSNIPYKRYKAVEGVSKPQREPQVDIPTAIISMMQTTSFDIEDHLGRYESSKGEASNERSGKAILARIAQSDKGTFTFADNFTRALIYGGKQIVDLIPHVYDTYRALRVRGETGEERVVEVNIPLMDENGNRGVGNDLTLGEFDLIATVAASSTSKREEMMEFIFQSMQYAPQLAPILAAFGFKYSDNPAAEEIYNELQKEIELQRSIAGGGGGNPASPPPVISGGNSPPAI